MPSFRVTITREDLSKCSGKLKFEIDQMEQFEVDCWEAPDNLIPAKTYTGCSTTLMATKQFKSVYLPDDQTGKTGIFIHQGSSPSDSDGCIVASKLRVEEIYDTVPRDAANMTVVVLQ